MRCAFCRIQASIQKSFCTWKWMDRSDFARIKGIYRPRLATNAKARRSIWTAQRIDQQWLRNDCSTYHRSTSRCWKTFRCDGQGLDYAGRSIQSWRSSICVPKHHGDWERGSDNLISRQNHDHDDRARNNQPIHPPSLRWFVIVTLHGSHPYCLRTR